MKIIHRSGKRKRSVARATLREGKGRVRVNKRDLKTIAPQIARMRVMEPLILAGDIAKKVDIDVSVFGGGFMSQADASRLAIGRCLTDWSKGSALEKTFLNYDRQLLVADVRRKETRKPNDSKARSKRQKSYR